MLLSSPVSEWLVYESFEVHIPNMLDKTGISDECKLYRNNETSGEYLRFLYTFSKT